MVAQHNLSEARRHIQDQQSRISQLESELTQQRALFSCERKRSEELADLRDELEQKLQQAREDNRKLVKAAEILEAIAADNHWPVYSDTQEPYEIVSKEYRRLREAAQELQQERAHSVEVVLHNQRMAAVVEAAVHYHASGDEREREALGEALSALDQPTQSEAAPQLESGSLDTACWKFIEDTFKSGDSYRCLLPFGHEGDCGGPSRRIRSFVYKPQAFDKRSDQSPVIEDAVPPGKAESSPQSAAAPSVSSSVAPAVPETGLLREAPQFRFDGLKGCFTGMVSGLAGVCERCGRIYTDHSPSLRQCPELVDDEAAPSDPHAENEGESNGNVIR